MNEKQVKILVIDDDTSLASAIKLVLDSENYHVDIVGNSTDALEMIGKEFYSILLCDYNLPDMNGIELIKQAFTISSKSVPILITGVSSMDLAFDGMRLGVHDYLVKPIDYDELKKVIRGILAERKEIEKGKKKLQKLASDSLESEDTGAEIEQGQSLDGEVPEPLQQTDEDSAITEEDNEEVIKTPEEPSISLTPIVEDAETEEESVSDEEERKIVLDDGDTEAEDSTGFRTFEEISSESEENTDLSGGEVDSAQITDKVYPEGEMKKPVSIDESKEKTIFDFVLDRYTQYKKRIRNVLISCVLFTLLFLTIDTVFLQITGIGISWHNKIWPPAIVLDSLPSGAVVSLTNKAGIDVLESKNNTTPVSIPKILPGNYTLVMDMDMYLTIERKITIYGGKKITNISVPNSIDETGINGKTQKFIVPFEMRVRIESDPEDAKVYIDGKKMGPLTPITVDLTADLHTVMLEKEGFSSLGNLERFDTYGQCNLDLRQLNQEGLDARYWEFKADNKEIFLKGTFWKEITINSNPSNSQIFINGELLGVTPATIRVNVGEHDLIIKKAGYVEWNKTINVPEDSKIYKQLSKIVKISAYDEAERKKDLRARVWINKREIKGRTTPFSYSFKPGAYWITIAKPPDYVKWTKNIRVKAQNRITAYMQRKKYFVSMKISKEETDEVINSAEIYIDGVLQGATDINGIWEGNVVSGEHSINIKFSEMDVDYMLYYDKTISKNISSDAKEFEISMGYLDIIKKEMQVFQEEDEEELRMTEEELNRAKHSYRKVEKYLRKADKYYRKGNLNKAERELNKALELDPENKPALDLKQTIEEKWMSKRKIKEETVFREETEEEFSEQEEKLPVEEVEIEKPDLKSEEYEETSTSILIIDTRPDFPGATIYFNGREEGETIRRITDVRLGTHEIAIKHPYIGRVTSKIVVDKSGKKFIVNFNIAGEAELK